MKKIFLVIISVSLFFLFASSALGFSQEILSLQRKGVIQEEIKNPFEIIPREVFTKWLLKNAGFIAENSDPKENEHFLDVPLRNNPYAPYIYRLAALGLNISKEDGYFDPKGPISKREALEWIFFVEGIPVPKIFEAADFQADDVRVAAKFAHVIQKALKLGMLQPGKVRPKRKLTYAVAANFLTNVKQKPNVLTVTILPTFESDVLRNPRFDVFVNVWNKITQSYLRRDSINRENLIYGAIEGMLKELSDKHTEFERPNDDRILQSLRGEVEGIGAVVQMKNDQVVIVAPLTDSPAEKAGLLSGDIILTLDNQSVKGKKLSEVVNLIKGKTGTQVKIEIQRGSKILSFTITREKVRIISTQLKWTQNNIGVITIHNFGQNAENEFSSIAREIKKNKPMGLIIDLRNNPGGFLTTAIHITGYFVKTGEKIAVVRYPNREEPQYSSGNGELASFPTMILTNGGSASASEILAGAIQDHGLGKVIGEKTFGKGTVQELSDLSDGSSLKLTVAEWLTPKGRSIEKNGITPDIEVKITEDDRQLGKDPQMERAIEEIGKKVST